MRFGIGLPGPFFVSFGRSARAQAHRNLRVRAYERQIIAEAPMRLARRRNRIRLFWLATAIAVPIALISAAGSATLSPAIWGIVWPVVVVAAILTWLFRSVRRPL